VCVSMYMDTSAYLRPHSTLTLTHTRA
jgi:hypothetical protein